MGSKEAAEAALAELWKYEEVLYEGDYVNWADEYETERLRDVVSARLAELEAAVPRWIPVSERLPAKNGPVLIWLSKKQGRKQFKVMLWTDGHFKYRPHPCRGNQVTHWMPLPPSPAMEKSITPEVDDHQG